MIKAKIHTDDFVYSIDFDATNWFEQASSQDLVKLIMCNFRGRPADNAALFFEDRSADKIENLDIFSATIAIKVLFDYCRRIKVDSQCVINEDDARKWLKDNKGRNYFSSLLISAISRMKG